MAPKEGSSAAVGWGSDMTPIVSVRLPRLCIKVLALCGYMYKSYIATLDSTICVTLLLCLSYCHHPSHALFPPTHPLIYTGPILMNSMKKSSKTGKIQPLLFTYLVSCTKANRQLTKYYYMLSELVKYQGKAGFCKLNFQNGIS